MKLQILIPQYQETEEVIRSLLDSIAIQQNVDMEKELGVIIVNEGMQMEAMTVDEWLRHVEGLK